MKRRVQLGWLALLLAVSAGGYVEAAAEDAFRARSLIRNIRTAADWVVREGTLTYYREGDSNSFSHYVHKSFSVSNAGMDMPIIEAKGHLANFRLTTTGVSYRILNLYRETLPGGIYEFWIVKVSTDYDSLDRARCMFYVTRADDVRGRREILRRSNRFIERYKVASETYFDFPVDDLEVVSKMEAWRYPESYPDSDLKNLKVTKHWRTGRLTVERGDSEQWAYEEDRGGNLMLLSEIIQTYKHGLRAGTQISFNSFSDVGCPCISPVIRRQGR